MTPHKDAPTQTAFPLLGECLRDAITACGYRPCLKQIGLDKDLDDLAAEARPGSTCDQLRDVLDACFSRIAVDCGDEWAACLHGCWAHSAQALRALVGNTDIRVLPVPLARRIFLERFVVPMLSGFLKRISREFAGPDLAAWWRSPFQAWVRYCTEKCGTPEPTLLDNLANALAVDARTLQRWLHGDPIGKITWPFAPKVEAAIGARPDAPLARKDQDALAGWLLLAVGFQSIPPRDREQLRQHFEHPDGDAWSPEDAIAAFGHQTSTHGDLPVFDTCLPLLESILDLFEARPLPVSDLRDKLDAMQSEADHAPGHTRRTIQLKHDWFAARLAAFEGDQPTALALYAQAISCAWWSAGINQASILKEALLYAVGIGDKVVAEHYWDKTFLLGLNREPKRALDAKEIRRLSFAFERFFHPQKAKSRVPPPIEIVETGCGFRLEREHLKHPNRKIKFAGGRTRRTPLMQAIMLGAPQDVQRLLEAGGDPNAVIEESGEGPLTYALRHALQTHDQDILARVLALELSEETVNRPASTARDTPIKLAIQMADAEVVARLIALGAKLETPCGEMPSALCFAMSRFGYALNPGDVEPDLGFFAGLTRAGAIDAKLGAVFDAELHDCRQSFLDLIERDARFRMLFHAIKTHHQRPVDDCRAVIRVLVRAGADANCRYLARPGHTVKWTPTLFAAELGDLDVFKMLVEHPGPNRGDPGQTLTASDSPLVRYDALWVATMHSQHAIVSYLRDRCDRE